MKKLFVLAAMMMATITASAQFEPGTFSIQPRVGFTASMISNMPKSNFSVVGDYYITLDKQPAVGLIAGADLEYQITEMFSLSAGVNYAMQGSAWEDYKWNLGYQGYSYSAEINDYKIEADYLNVPVTLNCYIIAGLSIRTGVQFGFLTTAKEKGELKETGRPDDNFNNSVKDSFEKFDVSIPVGISYEFPNHLVIDTRYNIGLSKVFKDNYIIDKNGKNQVFTITLGYKIPF